MEKRFKGNAAAAKAWMGRRGAFSYDAPYRQDGIPAVQDPGTPEEFLANWEQTRLRRWTLGLARPGDFQPIRDDGHQLALPLRPAEPDLGDVEEQEF